MTTIDRTLAKLEQLIKDERFEQLETDTIEIKPVPPTGGDWKERKKSVNAFLNSRGGILILGIKEETVGQSKRYALTGWRGESEEGNVRAFAKSFTDQKGSILDLTDYLPPPSIKEILGRQIALVFVDELADDRKFVFFEGTAYKRHLTGDVKISPTEIEAQEEFREEAIHARELQPVSGLSVANLDIDKLNEYIHYLNRRVRVETIKSDLASAEAFLARKIFVKDGRVTTLGALVCAAHPGDVLGFRCHVHGYVDVPQEIAKDKQDYIDNILPLREKSLAYLLRNIQVGISARDAGTSDPQYPEELLRETMNNALAHRDYSIDKQTTVSIKPGIHVAIRNPGQFRSHLLREDAANPIPLLRIIPEARARNPKLADVLRVFNKWEGKGIGMATLVNLCLENRIDLPYYRFYSEEVALFLVAGQLLDAKMERFFQSFDGFLEERLQGNPPSEPQKRILSYLIKSEWANRLQRHTILLTTDNNHSQEIAGLEKAGLIRRHEMGSSIYPVFVVDRVLAEADYLSSLREMFGFLFDALEAFHKKILDVVWRYVHYSKQKYVSAKQAAFALWYDQFEQRDDIAAFDSFYRKVRRTFNSLETAGFVQRIVEKTKAGTRTKGYQLNRHFRATHLT
jgi:ATP-dependent DNA helicase RecG